MAYNPKYKSTQIMLGTGEHTIIATGWTSLEMVQKAIPSERYAAIGNLYSIDRGLNIMIRNLLLNPQIKRVILLMNSKLDNNAQLNLVEDFFTKGVKKSVTNSGMDCWVINSATATRGYIDIQIPLEVLDYLRSYIDFKIVTSIVDLKFYVGRPVRSTSVEPMEAMEFDHQVERAIVRRGVAGGHLIREKTVVDAWIATISRIRSQGFIQPTGYEGEVQGVQNLMTVITDEGTDLDSFFLPDYVPVNREFLENYIPYMCADNSDSGVRYTYGSRLISWFKHNQIDEIVDKLKKEPIAASGVMSLWDAGDFGRDSDNQKSGSPCLNHIQIQIVEGKLTLSALFRSQDSFMAYVPNTLALRALQVFILEQLEMPHVKIGNLTTTANWAHIYSESWNFADGTLATLMNEKAKAREFADPVGNFNICLDTHPNDEKYIICTEQVNGGELVQSFRGVYALKMIREIALANPNISPDHIGYLGMELARAEIAVKSGTTYTMG